MRARHLKDTFERCDGPPSVDLMKKERVFLRAPLLVSASHLRESFAQQQPARWRAVARPLELLSSKEQVRHHQRGERHMDSSLERREQFESPKCASTECLGHRVPEQRREVAKHRLLIDAMAEGKPRVLPRNHELLHV
tara:strand:+ start:8910 stop:9323 length:414 start_codon:yes stop_codon:yes gene_type:complete